MNLKESMWPNDVLAGAAPIRMKTEREETRVEAKAKMLSMIPDDLKRLVGNHVAKRGILRYIHRSG